MILKKEFEYYLEHREEIVEKYIGRTIVIKNQKIIGDYDNEVIAIKETSISHKLGTFLVQDVTPGLKIQKFHSRVSFLEEDEI